MGAWIETSYRMPNTSSHSPSHSTWVRELKLHLGFECTRLFLSHPKWMRGLKHINGFHA